VFFRARLGHSPISEEEKVRILIYEVSKGNWRNAVMLGVDMK